MVQFKKIRRRGLKWDKTLKHFVTLEHNIYLTELDFSDTTLFKNNSIDTAKYYFQNFTAFNNPQIAESTQWTGHFKALHLLNWHRLLGIGIPITNETISSWWIEALCYHNRMLPQFPACAECLSSSSPCNIAGDSHSVALYFSIIGPLNSTIAYEICSVFCFNSFGFGCINSSLWIRIIHVLTTLRVAHPTV